MTEEEKKIIETVDENGNIIKFELFDIVEYENIEYALLTSAEENSEDDDEIVVMRLIQDNDGYSFETIGDDNEFEKISEYLEKLAEEGEE